MSTAGKRRTFVTIQSASQAFTGAELISTWSTLRDAWVEQRQLSGGERTEAAKEDAFQVVEFRGLPIDWSDVTTAHQVAFNSLTYKIRRIDRSDPAETIVTTEQQA